MHQTTYRTELEQKVITQGIISSSIRSPSKDPVVVETRLTSDKPIIVDESKTMKPHIEEKKLQVRESSDSDVLMNSAIKLVGDEFFIPYYRTGGEFSSHDDKLRQVRLQAGRFLRAMSATVLEHVKGAVDLSVRWSVMFAIPQEHRVVMGITF
jgi:hypothetical protein